MTYFHKSTSSLENPVPESRFYRASYDAYCRGVDFSVNMSESVESSPKFAGLDIKDGKVKGDDVEAGQVHHRQLSVGSLDADEVFNLQDIDPALNAKMHLVNDVRSAKAPDLQRVGPC